MRRGPLLLCAAAALALALPGAAGAGKSKGMPGTRQTVGGPAAYRLEPGESDTVLEGQSVCVTIQAGKGGELLIAGSRFPAGRTRAVCLNAPVVLQCDAAGKACRGFWRADR